MHGVSSMADRALRMVGSSTDRALRKEQRLSGNFFFVFFAFVLGPFLEMLRCLLWLCT